MKEKLPLIIDNEGIKRGSEVIDILAGSANIRQFLLDLTERINPKYLPQAEEMISGLRISLGARSVNEVAKEAFAGKLQRKGLSLEQASQRAGTLIFFLNDLRHWGGIFGQIDGFYIFDKEQPYLYIDSGSTKNINEMRLIWDREAFHFVHTLEKYEHGDDFDYDRLIFDEAKHELTTLGIDLALASSFTGVMMVGEEMSRRSFLQRSIPAIGLMGALFIFPVKFFSEAINYNSNPEEGAAITYSLKNQTSPEDFAKLFEVKKRI